MKKLFTSIFQTITLPAGKAVFFDDKNLLLMRRGLRFLVAGGLVVFTTCISNVYAQCPNITTPASNLTVECDGSGNIADLNNWLLTNGGAVEDGLCGSVTWSNDFTALSDLCGQTGSATVTFTATDGSSNTATTTATFTIQDSNAPVLFCAPDETAGNDLGFCSSFRQAFPPLVLTEDCDGTGSIVPTTTTDFNVPFPLGPTTVVWMASDACNNSSSCSYTITITDIEEPHVASPNDFVLTVSSVGNSQMDEVSWSLVDEGTLATVASGGGYGAHSSNITVIDLNSAGPFTFNISTEAGGFDDNVATWTLTCNGNTVSSGSIGNPSGPSQTLAITSIPVCNDIDTSFFTDSAFCTYTNIGTSLDPVIIENCAAPTTTYTLTGATTGSGGSSLNGVAFNVGTTIVTWSSVDAASNSSTSVFQVVVADTAAPIIVTPASDLSVECDGSGNNADLTAWLAANGGAVATDPCGSVTWSNDYTGLSDLCGATGSATVTFTATGPDMLSAQTTATFTIVDTTPPGLTCPPDESVDNDQGYCSSYRTPFIPLVSDVCDGGVITPTTTTDFNMPFPLGPTTVTWTAVDACGNTGTCSYVITVVDAEDPHVAAPNDLILTIDAVGNSQLDEVSWSLVDEGTLATVASGAGYGSHSSNVIVIDPTSAGPFTFNITTESGGVDDNVASWTLVCNGSTINSGTIGNVGGPSETLQFTAIPLCNSIDTNFVTDIGECNYTNTGTSLDAVVVENCPPATITYTLSGATTGSGGSTLNGVDFLQGTTIITWLAVDAAGNSSTATFEVVVTDSLPPVITCPGDQVLNNDLGQCSAVYNYLVTAVDNCDLTPTITQIGGLPSGSAFPVGVTLNTWVAVDDNGNADTCSFTVTVNDTELPVSIFCPGDTTDFAVPSNCGKVITYPAPTFSDNCGGLVVVQTDGTGLTSGQVFPVGTTIQTWTATDTAGNTAVCTFNITIVDNQLPIITGCPSDIIMSNDPGNCNAIVNWVAPTASDNCPGVTMVSSHTPGSTFSIGIDTVYYIATDASGNIDTCSFTVTINDTEDPTLTCPANIIVDNDPGMCSAVVNYAPIFSDNCPGVIINQTGPPSGSTFPVGAPTLITFTATDAVGNSSTCSFTITVNDTEAPTITCPGNISMANGTDTCGATVSYATPTFGDNCSGASVSMVSGLPSGSVFPVGVTNNIFMVTDAAGNSTTCSFTVTITDTQLPSITCAADTNVTTDPGLCTANITLTAPATTDNCLIASVTNDHPSTTYPTGTTSVTWTVTDVNGNSSTCIQDVNVTDGEDPTIGCPSNINTSAAFGLCEQTVTTTNPTINDNCSVTTLTFTLTGATTLTSPLTGINNAGAQTFNVGTTTITYTATDAGGNSSTCSFTVTVIDNQNPVITCPSNITVSNDAGVCGAVVTYTSPVGTDNCAGAITTQTGGLASGATFPVGTTVNSFLVTDLSGNTANCSFTVTVNDTEVPTITCPTDTVQTADAGLCSAVITTIGTPVTNDNCLVASVTNNHPSTTYPVGVTSVTWTVVDVNGNSSTCIQLVTVTDDEDPIITCPSDITVPASFGTCDATGVNLGTPTTSDNCTIASVTNNHPSTTYPVGTTPVIWTVTDINGNSATCTQNVTVIDNQNPVINCPSNITVSNDAGVCGAVVTYTSPVGTDNCAGAITTQTGGLASGATFPVGTTVNTFLVTDLSGNTASCSFTVTVNDTEVPTITCPTDTVQTADAGLCSAVITTLGTPVTGDNCLVASVTNNHPSTTYPVGVTSVTWTVVDVNGNSSTCIQLVTVTDDEDPIITCPSDITVPANFGTCDATGVNLGTSTTSDNCTIASVSNNHPSTTYPIGTTPVVWTVTDVNGNSSTCTQNVTVIDNQNPVINCPSNITVSNDAGVCGAVVTYTAPVGTDNCAGAITTQTGGLASGATFPVGTTVNTFLVTDLSGNTATCSFTVTVNDTEVPTITCPTDTVQTADAGLCSAVITTIGTPVTNDNCLVASVTNNHPSTTYPVGTTNVVWTVTDVNGNSSTCVQLVTVTDDEEPIITCPSDITVPASFGTCDATGVNLGTPTTSDNCTIASVTNNHPSTTYPVGTTPVVWTVTDINGNSATCTQNVTVIDNQNPVINCPSNITLSNDAGVCGAVVTYTAPVGTDNCAGAITTQTGGLASGAVFPVGTTVNTFLVTDLSGNTANCSFTVTVNDTEVPMITCPTDTVQSTDAGSCSAVITTLGTPTTSDNCTIASVSNNHPSTTYPVGVTSVIWTVTDVNGNSSTCVQLVTVTDDEDPIITCPSDITVPASFGTCDATGVNLGTPTTSDNCTIASVTNNHPSTTYPVGTTPVVWTVTDVNGNSSTCTQDVIVIDNQNPTIVCPGNITQTNDAGVCGAVVTYTAPVGTDNCAGAITTQTGGLASGATFPVGTTVNTFLVTDLSGNTASCSFTVTVNDTEVPTITCPTDTVQTADAGLCSAVITTIGTPVTNDNCLVASVTNNHPSTTYPVGTTNIVWTVTDVNGNSSTCVQLVTVTDDEDPIITCPSDITVPASFGTCDATGVNLGTPTTSDNCTITSVTNNHPSTTYPVGTTPVVWTVTDVNGNSATCTQDVTVIDNQNPTIVCPSNITVSNDAGVCGAVVTYTAPIGTDNCAGAITTQTGGLASGVTFPVGITVNTFLVTDASGNTASCSFTVTVNDTEVPTITCPTDTVQSADAGSCSAVITTLGTPVTNDNCLVATVSNNHPSTTYPVGTTNVVWTVTDVNGNSSTCIQLVTVTDDEDPIITCPSDITIPANFGTCDATGVNLGTPTTSDNCTIASVTNDHPSTTYPVGTTPVVWTVTDINGNSATCTQNVTVIDNQNPTIVCPGNITQTNDAGVCGAVVTYTAPVGTDNCAGAITTQTGGLASGATFPVGITVNTFLVTDLSGNTASCSFTVTVNDTEVPTITCPTDTVQSADAGSCSAVITTIGTPVTNDNCLVASVTNNHPSTTYPVGVTSVTWTVVDVNGNSSTCIQLVTVTDDEDPMITCPSDITIPANFGTCDATGVNLGTPTTSDNCTIASVTNNHPSTTYPVGTTPVIWTVTDVNGNSATCTQNVTVIDNQNPVITCPSNITVSNDAGVCGAVVTYTAPIGTDNCAGAITTQTGGLASGATFPVGTTVNSFLVTDLSGNTANCSFTVTVNDTEVPTITCPTDTVQTADAGSCSAVITTIGTPVTGDNCLVASVTNNHPSTTYPVGTTSVIWTVTDVNGNSSTCVQLVTVTDDEDPIITCPSDITIPANFGTCDATGVNLGTPTTSDNCTIASVTNDHPSTTYPVGTTPVVWTVTDVNGNSATCTQNVIVIDNQNPTIVCPGNITQANDPGLCGAVVTYTAPIGTDNCTGAITTQTGGLASGATFPVGTTVNSFLVTDASGNTANCSFTVTVTDNEAPVIACGANVIQDNDSTLCSANVTVVGPTTSDNCLVLSVVNNFNGTNDASGVYPVGTTNVVWTVTDVNGNTSTCVQTVTVNDTEAPVTACTNITVNTTPGLCGASVNYTVNYTENCPGATVVQTDGTGYTSGNFFPVGTTVQTYVITDAAGNSAVCNFTVTVVDNELPLVVCPSNISVINDPGVCGANITMVQPVYSDNCNIASVINNYNGTSDGSGFYPVDTTTVIWTVTDVNGNSSTCSMTVIVSDTEAPSIACAPDQTQTNDSTLCSANVTVVPPTVNDNCLVATVVNDFNNTSDASGVYPVGTTPVIWTVTDIHGNSSTCTQLITVTDDELPIIACSPDQTQNNDLGICGANVTVLPPATSDNCSVGTLINDFNMTSDASGLYPVGTTTVTWTATDIHGNSSTCIQLITVIDNEAPVADLAFLPTMVGECSVTAPTPTATDNCDGTINGTTLNPVTYTAEGTYVITWTYTDAVGNTSTQTQTVIIDDTTPPVPNVAPLPTVTAECNVTVAPPTALDNCLGIITATTTDPLTYTTQGTFNITWTYDDGNGNTSTQTQTVIVDDITAPVPDVTTLPALTDECSVTATPPTATDNCSGTITATTTDPLTYTTQGTFNITWTYDDGNGNTSTQTQTVIIDDVTPPVASASSLPVLTGECSVTVLSNPTATDNCGGVVTVSTSDPLFYNVQGTYTITWIYDDGNGNSSTQTQTVIVDDITSPVANVASLPTITAECNTTVSSVPTATDNCVGSVTGTTSDPLTYSSQGTYTITWTYDDGNGNTSTQTQTVIIDDVTAPVANVASIPDATGECSVTVSTAPTATDNCSGTITGTTFNPLTYTSQGTYTITWIYNDGNGNSSTQTQTVIVDDVTGPTPDTASLSTINAQCSVTVTPPTATDNCTGSVTATTFDPLTYNVQGTYTVTWIYFDGNGNTSTQTQTVIVDDNTAPVPDTGSLATVTGACSVTVTGTPTATDNCDGTITGTTSDPLTYASQGTYVITWIYTDASGNTSTQTQTVIVDDNVAPIPALSTLPDVVGECSATVVTVPTATDNCAGTITGTTSDPLTYSTSGTYTVTWVFDDGNGNIVTQTQTVIVSDNTAPVPSVSFLPNITGNCAVTVFNAPTATDNCAGTITGTTSDAISYNVPGSYTITWVFDDGNGNITTQNQTVIVNECLGVDPSGESLDANVYPSPGNGIITIELNSMPEDGELRLLNDIGQVVYLGKVTGQIMTYDFTYLKAGTYYVQVMSSKGNFTKTIIITQKY